MKIFTRDEKEKRTQYLISPTKKNKIEKEKYLV